MAGSTPRPELPEKHGIAAQSLIRKLTTEKAMKAHRQQTDDKAATEEDITTIKLASRGIKTIESLDLPSLRRLDLSKNNLNRLKGLQGCSQVTYLTAAGNELTGEGLDGVRPLKNLKVFNASGNRVRRIPPAVFAQLRQLQALVLNNNEISEVPPTWFKKGLLSLNTFVLSHNKVASLSDAGLGRLTALTKLSVSHNALIELPDLSACSGLEELRAAHNLISQVPASLSKNAALRTLDLGHNRIDKWVGLERLGKSLKSLMQLSLAGNPLCGSAAATAATNPGGKEEEDEGQGEGEGEGEYVAKIRSLFPGLKVRDGKRVLMKKSHTYYEQRDGGEEGGGGGGEGVVMGRAAAATTRTGKAGAGRTERKGGLGGADGAAGDPDGDGRRTLVARGEKRVGGKVSKSGKMVIGGKKERGAPDGATEKADALEERGGGEAGTTGKVDKKKKKKKGARAAAEEAAAEAGAETVPFEKVDAKSKAKKRRRRDVEPQEGNEGGRHSGSAVGPPVEVAGISPADASGGKKKKKQRSAEAATSPARAEGIAAKAKKLKIEIAKKTKKIPDKEQEDPYSSSEELPIPGKQEARDGVVVGSGSAAAAAGAKKTAAAAAAAAVPVGGDRESGVVSVVVNKKRKGAKGTKAKPWQGGAAAVAGAGSGGEGAQGGFSVEAMLEARGQKETIGLGLAGVSSWD